MNRLRLETLSVQKQLDLIVFAVWAQKVTFVAFHVRCSFLAVSLFFDLADLKVSQESLIPPEILRSHVTIVIATRVSSERLLLVFARLNL